jgi:hypothetical protein
LTLTFHATPPWDPKSKGFPNDLALLVAYAAVMPARDSKVGGGLTTPGAAESMQK